MTAASRLAAVLAADLGVREHRDGTSETAPTAASLQNRSHGGLQDAAHGVTRTRASRCGPSDAELG